MKHVKRSATHPLVPNKAEYCYVDGKKKRKYRTETDAEVMAPTKTLQQYVCDYCGFWHNGNARLTH
jgi:hypothetical protein